MNISSLESLTSFRQQMYQLFTRRRDALFGLTDALLTTGPTLSPAHLSLASSFQRGWGSVYDALVEGQIDGQSIERLLAQHLLEADEAIYAVDASVWARCDAETSPERAFYHHLSRHSAGQPIVAGWAYHWIAQVSFAHDSWTAPRKVCRLKPGDNINQLAVGQIKELLQDTPEVAPLPIFVFDAGYEPGQLALAWGSLHAAALTRLRSGRCFYADPSEAASTGRPPRHGHKFACADPTTWLKPNQEYVTEDSQYGRVRVRAWHHLHAIPQNHPKRGTRGPRPIMRGTLILVEVAQLPKQTRVPKQLWLWWHAPEQPLLPLVWRAYVARFLLEHTFRFAKQYLNWTLPRVHHPEQADRWTWLVVLAYTQLRLARPFVADHRLPWEKPLVERKLTPYRVRRAFPSLLRHLPVLANLPKPCGRSPGRPKGRLSGHATRYPAVKKAA
ncbi:NF041680 family putative transposase [Dictyobacter kobayashii]|nr:NF041680 family putative transposase [Dictyobacter kobayashii]